MQTKAYSYKEIKTIVNFFKKGNRDPEKSS